MITLTIQCSRCSKEVSQDMTNRTLSDDLIRKFGFIYAHNGKTNVVLCSDCGKQYSELQDRIELAAQEELCGFFEDCGEEGKNGHKGKPKNG